MKLKKILFCVLALALLTLPASAHGHNGGGCHSGRPVRPSQPANPTVTVCKTAGCTTAGRHVHNGVTYCGYPHESGVCDNNCRALCPVEGCTLEGQHSHRGTAYCGDYHPSGFCEGICHAV